MPKEYLYRVANRTPGAPDRLVIGHQPGQALRFVSEDMLSVELCDGITAAELVLSGITIERAVPVATPEPETPPKPVFDPAVVAGETILSGSLGPPGTYESFVSRHSTAVQPNSVGAEPAPQPDERL